LGFPSTVLFPRESRSAGGPKVRKLMLLSVTVAFDIVAIATPVERVWIRIPMLPLFDATQLSIFDSTAAAARTDEAVVLCHRLRGPVQHRDKLTKGNSVPTVSAPKDLPYPERVHHRLELVILAFALDTHDGRNAWLCSCGSTPLCATSRINFRMHVGSVTARDAASVPSDDRPARPSPLAEDRVSSGPEERSQSPS
jgi:hypothetical protein